MTQAINALSQLTKLSSEEISSDITQNTSVYDQQITNTVSSAFGKISDMDSSYKSMINTLSQSPQFTSDPAKLLKLQEFLGEYNNYVSLVSTLGRKATGIVETLEKTQ